MSPLTSFRRRALAAASVAAAGVAFLCAAPTASAQCGGNHCLPGGGYDHLNAFWNCGAFYGGSSSLGGRCYPWGQLGISGSVVHTFGFGSADYDGSGDGVGVAVEAVPHSGGGYGWGHFATSLARACYAGNCWDQDHANYYIGVWHNHTHRHTIYGHGKA